MDLKARDRREPSQPVGQPRSSDANDEIKFVLADRNDYEWMRTTIRERQLDGGKVRALLASCVFGSLGAKELVSWVLEDHLDVAAAPDAQVHLGIRRPGV